MDEKAMGGPAQAIDDRLEELAEQFRLWREGRRRGDRIPAQLWAAAVDMALELGVARVANKLRLNAVFLRKRMEGTTGEAPTEVGEPEFVELATMPAEAAPAAVVAGVHECVVELHNARGAKMRVELNAGGLAGLAHLCHAFWGAV